jgi:hypothetical protein
VWACFAEGFVHGPPAAAGEDEQYASPTQAVQGMQGLPPVTIRTVDIGSDKPLDRSDDRMDKARNATSTGAGAAHRADLADHRCS